MSAAAGIPAREDLDGYLTVAQTAARVAGKIITAAWDQPRKIEHKGKKWSLKPRIFRMNLESFGYFHQF
jgi:hypothetical protein